MSKQTPEGKHTPTPWQVDSMNSLSVIDSSNDHFHGLICQTNGKAKEEALANRDKIIEAVNSHDELLSELAQLKERNEQLEEKTEDLQIMSEAKDMALKDLRERNEELVEALKEAYNEKVGNISGLKFTAAERAEKYKQALAKNDKK